MLSKAYTADGTSCIVTFTLPPDVNADTACLAGDFNDWDETVCVMTCKPDGSFETSLTLDCDRAYRFRYVLDGERWENDWQADRYAPNVYGEDDSIVEIRAVSAADEHQPPA
ncbi:MAG: isoamylase early set domain-containing protein [Chloroflexi bacterium]|nr:isoamylase early set domain-containing protein [Chloroflexota bacterium]